MTNQEFETVMALGHDLRGLEFKGPGPMTIRRLVAQVVKAALGMANRRDGGNIVIGVSEEEDSLNPVGLEDVDLITWGYDTFAEQIARYADPSVSFELEPKEYNGKQYILIKVTEFEDIPILCKRAYDDVLRDGACYVRTHRKPETSELPTQTEMRDLLDLATEKGVRRYLEQAQRIGIISLPAITPKTADEERFNQELGDLI